MGLNLLLLVVGLVICFGGIYIRKVCSAILGLIWGALCSFAVILMTVGLWGIDDETFIIVAVCAIACALISVIYDKLCAAINAFLSSFFLVAILLLMADSMESATLIIIAAVIALIVSIISVKIYNYSFIIMTAFSGAFIASIGGCGIIYNADASRVFLNLMLGDDVAGFILIGTLVLGVLNGEGSKGKRQMEQIQGIKLLSRRTLPVLLPPPKKLPSKIPLFEKSKRTGDCCWRP